MKLNNTWKWIVLIGYRASGKSYLGKNLSQALGLEFFDQDALIEERSSMSISQIFELFGEEGFRDRETQVLFSLPKRSLVLATGGGVVERSENMKYLAKRSKILFINPDLEILKQRRAGDNRPQLRDGMSLESEFAVIYSRRLPLYRQYADLILESSELQPCLDALETQ